MKRRAFFAALAGSPPAAAQLRVPVTMLTMYPQRDVFTVPSQVYTLRVSPLIGMGEPPRVYVGGVLMSDDAAVQDYRLVGRTLTFLRQDVAGQVAGVVVQVHYWSGGSG